MAKKTAPQSAPSPSRVSMKHIAQKIGMSVMTVSRALKDNPSISLKTRKRIQKLAKEMGYQPHPYVTALMSNLAQTRQPSATVNLAVFYFETLLKLERHNYYKGIVARARELGYNCEPFSYDPSTLPVERLRKILLARGIRGIILMPASEGSTSLDFDFSNFAAAALGHTIVHPPLPRVASDIYSETFEALDQLILRGYKRIGLISTAYVNQLARFLYSAAVYSYGKNVAPSVHLVEYTLDEPAGSEATLKKMTRWIQEEKLDVVICPVFGLPFFQFLRKQGFQIPADLAYLHLLDHADPEVSYLGQNGEFMGAKAVDMVVAMINRNEFRQSYNPHTISTLPIWHEGKTLPFRK